MSNYKEMSLEPIFSLSIVMQNGSQSQLNLYQYDTPLQMAYRFAVDNSLQLIHVKPISESIKRIIVALLSSSRVEESLKNKIRQSYEKYALDTASNIEFKHQYRIEELIEEPPQFHQPTPPPKQEFCNIKQRMKTDFDREITLTPSHNNSVQKRSLYDRGVMYKQMVEEKNNHIRSFQEENNQKQCTFSPLTNSQKQNILTDSSNQRFQKLYEYGKQKLKDKRSTSDYSDKDVKELQNCTFSPKIGVKSRMIGMKKRTTVDTSYENPTNQVSKLLKQLMQMETAKHSQGKSLNNRLWNVFRQLDHDKDGVISSEFIDVDSVNVNVLKILYPVFQMMDDDQLQLNYQNFESIVHQCIPNIEQQLEKLEQGQNNYNSQNGHNRMKQSNFQVTVKNRYRSGSGIKRAY